MIVPHDDSLNVVDQLSVSMWLKIDSFSNIWSPVFHKGGNKLLSGGKDRQYAFWLKNNSIGCLLSAGDNAAQKLIIPRFLLENGFTTDSRLTDQRKLPKSTSTD